MSESTTAADAASNAGSAVDSASNVGTAADAAGNATQAQGGFWSNVSDWLNKYGEGEKANMGQAFDKFGNNPETYGYIGNKLSGLVGKGGASGQPSPISTSINYQAPEDPYSKMYAKYRRY